MNPIKFIDLRPIGTIASKLNEAYDRVFNSSQYIGGKEVEAFENEWAEYCGVKYCVGVGNGHDALSLACRYFSDPPITFTAFAPWKTCIPTWAAIKNGGLSPTLSQGMVFGIVIAVHIYGFIHIPLHERQTYIIEDCAQAHGASLRKLKAGQFGDVAAWSFYPTKNLGALGDAGAVTTSKQDIAEFVRKMHNYGTTKNYGINSRLDPLQAAFLRAKLPYLDQWNQLREENAWTYLNNIHHYEKVTLPFPLEEEIPSWHIFAIETENRDGLREYLSRHNIETMIHYPVTPYPSSWQPVQEAEKWTRTTLSLPVAPHVTPYICKQIADLINQWMDHD